MRRFWPALLLLLMLLPLPAAGAPWVREESAPAMDVRPGDEPASLLEADALPPAPSLLDPAGSAPHRADARAASPPGSASARTVTAANTALRVRACSPHCERLPYDATAPPAR